MPRKVQKFHYIYKTTCIITNKFYIGMHSTNNLEDGYLGSGKKLWHSINKYGKENHKIEILEFLLNREELKKREKEIVNEELLEDKMCMNLQLGGGGGFSSEEHKSKFHAGGGRKVLQLLNERNAKRMKEDLEYRERWLKNNKRTDWTGKKHSNESKLKIGQSNSIKQMGENNSQFGTHWITNEIESKKINKGDTIPEGWRLGRKIKAKLRSNYLKSDRFETVE